MNFAESDEHAAIRHAGGAITDKFGPTYFAERAAADEPTNKLWKALADNGFIGINLPEEYGGGGGGMTELALVCEETAAHGCPLLLLLVSSAISGELIAKYGAEGQHLVAADGRRHDESGLCDHRTRRRLEHPQGVHDGSAGRKQVRPERN